MSSFPTLFPNECLDRKPKDKNSWTKSHSLNFVNVEQKEINYFNVICYYCKYKISKLKHYNIIAYMYR